MFLIHFLKYVFELLILPDLICHIKISFLKSLKLDALLLTLIKEDDVTLMCLNSQGAQIN